jgi:hypothetical protein
MTSPGIDIDHLIEKISPIILNKIGLSLGFNLLQSMMILYHY